MEVSSPENIKAPTDAFLQLPSNKSRRQALQELMHVLTHQQIRDLRSMTDGVDFRCDIVAKLPFEISEMILQHLPLRQAFQAHRVSKSWRDALASPGLVTSLLRSWYPRSHTPSPVPDGLSAKRVAAINAEHVDAYKRGKASSMRSYSIAPYPDGVNPNYVAYADGLVAWIDQTDCCICKSLDLKVGYESSFMTEDKSRISHLALSSSMIVVMCMSGKCYIWTSQGDKSLSLRMPSISVSRVLVSNKTLAIAFRPQFASEGGRVAVITWTLDSQRTHSFPFTLNAKEPYTSEIKLMLDKEGASIILFERPLGRYLGKVERTHFTRASLNGAIRAQGVVEGPCVETHQEYSSKAVPVQVNQHATIWASVGAAGKCDSLETSSELVRVRYDFSRDRVDYDKHLVKGFDPSSPISDIFFYKSTAYYRQYRDQDAGMRVIDFDESICTLAPMSTLSSWHESWLKEELKVYYHSLLFGDEDYLVHVFDKGILVRCFDRRIKMVEDNIAYRRARG